MVDQLAVIKKLEGNSSLLDVLIKIEDWMDSLDLQSYSNWYQGLVVDGPTTSRYWVKVTLQYPYHKMPDPRGGMRMVKYGAKITYKIMEKKVPLRLPNYADPGTDRSKPFDNQGKPKMKKVKTWLVELTIPKRYVSSISLQNMQDSGVDVATMLGDNESETPGSDTNAQNPSASQQQPQQPAADLGFPTL